METQTNTQVPAPAPTIQPTVFMFPKASKILAEAKEIYKAKFKNLFFISLITIAVVAIPSFAQNQGANFLKSVQGPEEVVGWILGLLFVILIIYVSIWSFAATIRCIMSTDPAATVGKFYSESSHDVLPLFFTGILLYLIILGGFILLAIPGIIFCFWYSQTFYVVITEGLSGMKALSQSKNYAKGNINEIFKKGFFIGLISILIAIAVGIVFGTISQTLKISEVTKIASLIFQVLWTPLVTVYAFLLFQYLRQSKINTSSAQ
ncbi:MAG: hypothetical protein HY918_03100 [Candidatus Doudnabacteria bacterium]|nr:hypothetical protein [Candidatus Doudnabacteria bacterium]